MFIRRVCILTLTQRACILKLTLTACIFTLTLTACILTLTQRAFTYDKHRCAGKHCYREQYEGLSDGYRGNRKLQNEKLALAFGEAR